MKRFNSPRGVFFLALLVIIILIAYYLVSMRGEKKDTDAVELTAVQNVLLRDLERNYPQTPKEVVRYYSEITKCFYNEDYTEEELIDLAMQVQALYDDELVANKDEESYLADLKSEISTYKESDWAISSYSTSASTDVDYFWEEGYECARLYCTFNVRTGTSMQIVEEIFVLRKDAEGHWKILGWDLVE
ncbi:MAG: hypothetical protein IJP31_02425 [Lachnospiraceae bacterium]|nr:hypothetical protein [Lachnospiraceae bacterium]